MKKILTLFIVISFCFSSVAYGKTFTDVSKEQDTEIGYMTDLQLFTGYGDGAFKPNDVVSNSDFVAMALKAYFLVHDIKWYGESYLLESAAYNLTSFEQFKGREHQPIRWKEAKGILSNAFGTTFPSESALKHETTITRGEAAVLLTQYMKSVQQGESVEVTHTPNNRQVLLRPLVYNGKNTLFHSNPIQYDGVVYIPITDIVSLFNGVVFVDDNTNKVIVNLANGSNITFTMNSGVVTQDHKKHTFKNPVTMFYNQLYMPAYYLEQMFHIPVSKDERGIHITSSMKTIPIVKEILDFATYSGYNPENFTRYIHYATNSKQNARTAVIDVNLDLDTKVNIKVNGDKINVLLNPNHFLDSKFVPKNLVKGKNISLAKPALDALNKMREDAKKSKISIYTSNAYRSYKTQKSLYKGSTDKYHAKPGFSEHQTGLCIDFCDSSGTLGGFKNTKAYPWMLKNAYKYGFIYRYPGPNGNKYQVYNKEEWHWRYIGSDLATDMKNKGIIYYEQYWALYIKGSNYTKIA